MKTVIIAILVLLSCSFVNGQAGVTFEGEKYFKNVKQLTFGGENAEAYFSFDCKQLIFQSKRDDLKSDQIFTMNVDGFGDRPNKISKYRAFTSEAVRFHDGFKLFYREDTNLMSPGAVLDLRPPA